MLGFVYFLGYEGRELENDEGYLKSKPIRMKDWYGYGFSLYQQYKTHQHSPHLTEAMRLVEHLWLDYLINLLVQVDDFPRATLTDQIPESSYRRFSRSQDTTEGRQKAQLFLESMSRFYAEVNFDLYLKENQSKYDHALAQVRKGLPDERFIPAMETFYGQHFEAYTLVPSLTIPTSIGFGARLLVMGKRTFSTYLAPSTFSIFRRKQNWTWASAIGSTCWN
ncbi:hypothetical protein ACO2Q8_09055 [Larkinella sp. VNQ87]|uniref:hypothetical protein n=1 Tax=Larkinella sp. VNQ87 TaxID=3400921 RepID=UPI003BFE81EE